MRKPLLLSVILLAVLGLSLISAFAASPLETIQTQVNKVLEVLRDPALKGEAAKETRVKKVWDIINGIFDYTELSKRTLAQHWKQFNPDQQKEFTGLFGKLLGGLYMDKIMAYTNEKVVFSKSATLSENAAEVQSEVITSTKSIPINYRMILENGEWKVYDVAIEGVSLVQNYRTQFREILTNKPPEDLLKMLREKVRK